MRQSGKYRTTLAAPAEVLGHPFRSEDFAGKFLPCVAGQRVRIVLIKVALVQSRQKHSKMDNVSNGRLCASDHLQFAQ